MGRETKRTSEPWREWVISFPNTKRDGWFPTHPALKSIEIGELLVPIRSQMAGIDDAAVGAGELVHGRHFLFRQGEIENLEIFR